MRLSRWTSTLFVVVLVVNIGLVRARPPFGGFATLLLSILGRRGSPQDSSDGIGFLGILAIVLGGLAVVSCCALGIWTIRRNARDKRERKAMESYPSQRFPTQPHGEEAYPLQPQDLTQASPP
uniref:Uncharacterized protein n=1 Tax=Plectus sambesii TaxID=2011161 RepID=A0A914ULI4_9BILA